jgi:hypothetical protein
LTGPGSINTSLLQMSSDGQDRPTDPNLPGQLQDTIGMQVIVPAQPDMFVSEATQPPSPQPFLTICQGSSYTALVARIASESILARFPSEIIYLIIDNMAAEDQIYFIFAAYPLMRARGMVWGLSRAELEHIISTPSISGQGWPLPNELTLQFLSYCRLREVVLFVFQRYHGLRARGLTPTITRSTFLILLLSLGANNA